MRWSKLLDRYYFINRPVLRAVNPRIGTSYIPLDCTDVEIFLQYLTNKLHALHFDGSELQLRRLITKMENDKRVQVQKIRTSARGRGKLMLLHLKFPNNSELRRVIKLS
jgi:hypothetical protein